MAFGIGTNVQTTDSGKVKGRQQEIACHCSDKCINLDTQNEAKILCMESDYLDENYRDVEKGTD